MEEKNCCHGHAHGESPKIPWVTITLALVSLLLWGSGFWFESMREVKMAMEMYFGRMAWPLLIGFILGGFLDYYIPDQIIVGWLGGEKLRSVFVASGLGILMSACSHGMLAIAMGIYRKGGSRAAVMSFLLASPWASLPILLLLFSFFGMQAIWILLGTWIVALVTGITFYYIDRWGCLGVRKTFDPESLGELDPNSLHFGLFRKTFEPAKIGRAIYQLAEMITVWFLVGMVAASLLQAWVPSDFFQDWMGPTIKGLIITLLAAAVIEVCSEGSAPLAFEIYHRTGALGNAFAFLMGGVVTDFTEIALVFKYLGKRSAAAMLILSLPQVFFFAWLMNQL